MPDYSDYHARKNGSYGDIWTKTGRCVFCDLKDKYIIAKNADAVLTVNLFPYIDGNLLVIPKTHVEGFLDISPKVWGSMRNLTELGIRLLQNELKIGEIWLNYKTSRGLTSGKSVSHGHLVIMPYTDGIMKWNYQEITIPPIELAERLRNAKISNN
ncbi:hypothetical protein CO058_04155 [candidate division WWE3 bacterium CG_4_9_14_0_2_um_filter_35_11]|uniref:HIT domain-containing protein n=1 Tax=candidate division WWE3 bacterium CG_4_9_14_0_2_um_filter_35_11 TaxID=1975077 RepID=A0A2M8EKS2_UNCKA|nr:MAG: hypothetical protein CO058_04155 [candidate division WWE3 bacterium CG_4_9_14_0_2_um_filter_35_11]